MRYIDGADYFDILILLMLTGVVIGLAVRTDGSAGGSAWPAYVALPVALLVVGAWHRATRRKDD